MKSICDHLQAFLILFIKSVVFVVLYKDLSRNLVLGFAKFNSTLHSLGFISSSHDFGLFLRRTAAGTILLLYVDDMIITVSSDSSGYYLFQVKYALDLLVSAGVTDSKTTATPIEPNTHLTPRDGTLLDNPTRNRQLVGDLVYLTVTRPDIAYAVHIVSLFMSAPPLVHYAAVLRILRYVKSTLFHGLHFSAHSPLQLSLPILMLIGLVTPLIDVQLLAFIFLSVIL
nr:uncharacterized protein LOC113704784 [Coffea arabica]